MIEAFLNSYYFWIKAFHMMAVMSWMAGLFYLPRLYVYHTRSKPGEQAYETFKIMEEKLLRVIMMPAMIASTISGTLMFYVNSYMLAQVWSWVKIAALIGMLATHIAMIKWRKDFELGQNKHSEVFYRAFNEVPTILMIIIVIMVVVKPWS